MIREKHRIEDTSITTQYTEEISEFISYAEDADSHETLYALAANKHRSIISCSSDNVKNYGLYEPVPGYVFLLLPFHKNRHLNYFIQIFENSNHETDR